MSGAAMRVAGLVVAVSLALSGCSGSVPGPGVVESPTDGPSQTATVAPSPSPSLPAKPKRPPAIERDDAAGAAAAAKYFIELYPYVMATGDTEEFEAMSHRACGFCDDALEQAERLRSRRELWTGGEIRSNLRESYRRDELTGIYPLDFEVEQNAARISDSEGLVLFQGTAERAAYRVEIGRKNGAWVVVEIAPGPAQ